jgi:Ca-activated chloride channel family protein
MNPAEFHFIRPDWLFALLPAILIFVLLLRNKLNRGNWSEVCDAELLPFILQEKPAQQSHWPLTAASLACLFTILALAGPTWERLPLPVFRNDSGLVIALDLSASMDASDIKPSRLIRARYKIADILKQRKDGQTALLVYAGDAFTVTPLTEDNDTIESQLSALKTDIMPSQGSNTLAAIKQAVALLNQTGLQQGHILLISDGIDADIHDELAAVLGDYRLSVLGIGTREGAPVKAAEGGFIKDAQGNIVVPKLNEAELSALADAGHGIYKTISTDDSDIDGLMAKLDFPVSGEKEAGNNLYLDQWDEKGPWLMLLILPLAALSFRKGLLSLALLVLLPFPQDSYALDWQSLWQTKDQQAQQAYNQKHYEQAAEQFDSAEWKAVAQYKAGQYQQAAETLQGIDDADGHYNRGNALAKAGQLQEAISAYQQALEIDSAHEDAKYNKELVEKQLKEQQKNQQQQGDDSQKSDDEQQQQDQDGDKSDQASDEQQGQQTDDEQSKQQSADDTEQPEQNDEEQVENESQPEEQEMSSKQQEQAAEQAEQSELDENQQATEQWLKRIPDDPAGLLKRKFRYQYGQRKNKKRQDQTW